MKRRGHSLALASFLAGAILQLTLGHGFADTITLTAKDTASIGTGGSINDNRLRAYYAGPTNYFDGFIKFDLSAIPNYATISSLTLTTYHEAGFANPYNNPVVSVFRSASDNWSRGSSAYPGLNELLDSAQTAFPSADLAPVTWTLNVAAFNYSTDLSDGILSLALVDRVAPQPAGLSFVYFYGSDASPAPPQLTVTFSVPEPSTWTLLGVGSVIAAIGIGRRPRTASTAPRD